MGKDKITPNTNKYVDVVKRRWSALPGFCTAASIAVTKVPTLLPLREALMKSFLYLVRKGFIITLDKPPTAPPTAQQTSNMTGRPWKITVYVADARYAPPAAKVSRTGTQIELGNGPKRLFNVTNKTTAIKLKFVAAFINVAMHRPPGRSL